MKKILLLLMIIPSLLLADAVIFSGNDVKALKQNIDLFGVVKVMSGSVDPSAGGGVSAPIGSAYLSTASGLYIKTGVLDTNWTKNALLPVSLTSEVTGILPIANGGTGSSTYTAQAVPYFDGTRLTSDIAGHFTFDPISDVLKINNVELGGTDAFGRNQMWNYKTNALLRLGSLASDGDPTTSSSEGSVFYGQNLQASVMDSLNFGYARIKPMRFGLYNSLAGVADYIFKVDPTSLYLADDSYVKKFEVTRTTGAISTSGQITSTVTTGTAPLVIASTTKVNNLHVERATLADSSTTNANLTGPITSVGNATSVASQTGTGSTFVMSTSPTLVTPNIGAASGSSLSVTGQLSSTVITGTAPLAITSTTKVNNLHVERATLADTVTTNANLTGDITSVGNASTYNNVVPVAKGGTNLSAAGSESQVLKTVAGVPAWSDVPNVPKNYITATDGKTIGAWVTYADAAGTNPVDGTGGASTATYTVSTNSDLRGSTNFLFTHTAANNQGNGFSYDFTIDPSDKGKVLQISMEYLIASGTYADDDLQFWIYDVTNASLIQPAPFKLKNSGIIEKFAMEFQTSQSTSYRLIGHVATSTATAYTIRFGNWNLGPQAKLYGSAITDWVAFTPTGSWSTNSVYTGRWRRVGSEMELEYRVSLGGAPNSTFLYFLLPTGYTIDGNSILATAQGAIKSSGIAVDAATQYYDVVGQYYSSTAISVWKKGAGGTDVVVNSEVTQAAPFTWGSGDYLTFTASVPITGWSSSTIMSSDADTRIVDFIGYFPTGQAVTANTTNFNYTTIKDTHGCWTGSTCVIKVPGDYSIGGSFTASANTEVTVYVNGGVRAFLAGGTGTIAFGGSQVLNDLKAGDVISFRSSQSVTMNANSNLYRVSIHKVQGPSQIQASESAGALYTGAPPTGTLNGSYNTVKFGTKVKDSHGAYNTSTGEYPVPQNGSYDISAQVWISGTYAINQVSAISIYVDGVSKYTYTQYAQASISHMILPVSVKSIPLLAGQIVTIRTISAITSPTYGTSADTNFFSITRSGNY